MYKNRKKKKMTKKNPFAFQWIFVRFTDGSHSDPLDTKLLAKKIRLQPENHIKILYEDGWWTAKILGETGKYFES